MLDVIARAELVAESKSTVLVTGETGTGKELVAQAIHARSAQKTMPLIKVNCAAIPETLLESELFGHVRGAFTGATFTKKGRFALADGGTIFLRSEERRVGKECISKRERSNQITTKLTTH